MSAYILSDLHHSTIALYIRHYNGNVIDCDLLANKLKRININSVNYRYNEKTKNSKCKLIVNAENVKFTKSDIIRLIKCWSYQSCEEHTNLDYIIMQAFLYSHFTKEDIDLTENESEVWSI